MSLSTQLLRGLIALPVLLMLAVAGTIAPTHPPVARADDGRPPAEGAAAGHRPGTHAFAPARTS